MIDDFVCTLDDVKSLEDWLAHPEKGKCPSCLLAPLASYYVGALEDAGESRLADQLKGIFEGGDPLTIGKFMDKIKVNVGDKLKQELVNLDCMAQVHEDAD